MNKIDTESPLPFAAHKAAAMDRLPGSDLGWLKQLREEAWRAYEAGGLPTTRSEAWRYTSLRPLEKADLKPLSTGEPVASLDRAPRLFEDAEVCGCAVFVDGQFNSTLSNLGQLPTGVLACSVASALLSDGQEFSERFAQLAENGVGKPMAALNAALFEDGFFLLVPDGVQLEQPLELVFVGGTREKAIAYHPRHLFILGEGAKASVVERHIASTDAAFLENSVSQVDLASSAIFDHVRIVNSAPKGFYLADLSARIAEKGTYRHFGFTAGARLARLEAEVRLAGIGASCGLSGAYLLRGQEHCDNTTIIEHQVPETACREVFKGVIDDAARAVFQGRIVVRPGAQKSDGHQLSKALLLSDKAEIDAKPELEIYADDVLCSHGAAAGEIDEESLFYLRSRGLDEASARRLLIEAFIGEALDEVSNEKLREGLRELASSWLGGGEVSE